MASWESELGATGRPRRVVVIDDDPALPRFVAAALRGPEFHVSGFVDPREALSRLGELAPDLILCDVCMPGMDGRALFEEVRRIPALHQVPFVFLSGLQDPADVVGMLEAGADDFLAKPLTLEHVAAKVRATLRLSERMSAPSSRDVLHGVLGPAGTLPLLRFCEDSRLSGRLGVEADGVCWTAEFEGGELLRATSDPASAEDPLDALLALRQGSYRIEQHPLDVRALREIEQRLSGPREAPARSASDDDAARLPGGRLSRVEVRGVPVEVQTEAENRPSFTITTVVIRAGQVIRKTESGWEHPLRRREEQELAQGQVDRQHERAVAALRELASGRPADGPGSGEAGLLAWALAFVAEQARLQLGAVLTVSLLRRTLRQVLREHPALAPFRVAEDARVFLVEGYGPLPSAVPAAATWIAAFLREAGALSERIGSLRLRQATRLMEPELEKCGFYAALEASGVRL